jgi:hypothetical protein
LAAKAVDGVGDVNGQWWPQRPRDPRRVLRIVWRVRSCDSRFAGSSGSPMSWLTRWFRGGSQSSADEQRLLVRCRNDRALADRLIAAELSRRPNLSRAAASRSALDRWSHER